MRSKQPDRWHVLLIWDFLLGSSRKFRFPICASRVLINTALGSEQLRLAVAIVSFSLSQIKAALSQSRFVCGTLDG